MKILITPTSMKPGDPRLNELAKAADELVFNPTAVQKLVSDMALTVASTREKVIMIEAGANEVPEAKMLEAIFAAREINQEVIKFIDTIVAECGKPKHDYDHYDVDEALWNDMTAFISPEEMEEAVFTDEKQVREENIRQLKDKLAARYEETNPDWIPMIDEAVYKYQKKTVRKMILKDHKRPDGRDIKQIRPLAAEVDLLPRAHGSAMFTRGQTQICTVTTLAPLGEAQRLDGLDEAVTSKRYMHHYNFPGYSVGEAKPARSPGRREIGHGALAERALLPVIPSVDDFPYAIRVVSEVVSSNGSTSQGSVCGSTLALMDAGVPISAPVAGISCGLIQDDDGGFTTFIDIQGVEDFHGEMDFKVAGTKKGITAIQMDIKNDGLSHAIIQEALDITKDARFAILDEVMLPCISAPRAEVSEHAPKMITVKIDPDKIREVIGKGGSVIQKITAESGAQIDIEEDGTIHIASPNAESCNIAKKMIDTIVFVPEVGALYYGKVVRILQFGAFVELAPGKDGMVHISKLANHRVAKVEDVINIGDMIWVKVTDIDEKGRVNLSYKDALKEIEEKKAKGEIVK